MVTLPLVAPDPQNTPISIFCVAFNIFVVGEQRDLKFGMQVDHWKSQPMDDKLFLKGAWSHHITHIKFLVCLNICGMV